MSVAKDLEIRQISKDFINKHMLGDFTKKNTPSLSDYQENNVL